MKIFIGSDHAGYKIKEDLKIFLASLGNDVFDKGAREFNPDDDYPDFIAPVAKEISKDPKNAKGIILGGSGQGEAMLANRFPNVRAAVYYGGPHEIVTLSRQHNNSNILSLGALYLSEQEAREIVKLWLSTLYTQEKRYQARIEEAESIDTRPAPDSSNV